MAHQKYIFWYPKKNFWYPNFFSAFGGKKIITKKNFFFFAIFCGKKVKIVPVRDGQTGKGLASFSIWGYPKNWRYVL